MEIVLKFTPLADWKERATRALQPWGALADQTRSHGHYLAVTVYQQLDKDDMRVRSQEEVRNTILSAIRPPPGAPEGTMLAFDQPVTVHLESGDLPAKYADYVRAAASRHELNAFDIHAIPGGVQFRLSTIYDNPNTFHDAANRVGETVLQFLVDGARRERESRIPTVAIHGSTFNQSPVAVAGRDVSQVSHAMVGTPAADLFRALREHVAAAEAPAEDKADAVEVITDLEQAKTPEQRGRFWRAFDRITSIAVKVPAPIRERVTEWIAGQIPGPS